MQGHSSTQICFIRHSANAFYCTSSPAIVQRFLPSFPIYNTSQGLDMIRIHFVKRSYDHFFKQEEEIFARVPSTYSAIPRSMLHQCFFNETQNLTYRGVFACNLHQAYTTVKHTREYHSHSSSCYSKQISCVLCSLSI